VAVSVPRRVQSVAVQWIRTNDQIISASGVVTFKSSAAPIVSLYGTMTGGSGNWAALAGIYDEFQVESIRVRFSPCNQYNGTFGMNFPYVIAYDNDGDMPITPSVALLGQYRTARMLSSGNDEEIVYNYSPQAANLWFNVTTPSAWPPQLGMLPMTNQPSFTGATPIVQLYIEYKVRFRGIR